MDIHERRNCLDVKHEKAAHLDYIVILTGRCRPRGFDGDVKLEVLYVPDRAVLKPEAFHTYMAALGAASWPSLEVLASTALEDLNNELIPRWIMVNVEHAAAKGSPKDPIGVHRIMLEDRRPKWDNPTLLSRLRPFSS